MDVAEERRFREFVSARSPALIRFGFLLTGGDQHAAEDLLQTVLVKTAARWSRVDDPEPYVRRAMYRQQVSWWRLASHRRETTVADAPEAPGPSARDHADAAEVKLVLRHALARLTPRQRAALVLRYFEDLPEAQVAQIMGCSVGTVRSTVHRSLARLRVAAPELADLRAPRDSFEEVPR
ncbi:RNA polymerase sigma24 factor [Sphaerisporangium krabiense]|uniref:RNA polymerase sigma-70 factor (Sigma-E family) n=1 Tax=Sphaerisporangium krabiense TaxID=763782 RepID=A0A7W8Z4K9_9ACTN|nr:SigE family RNA polymerase sigma factor [Sphaerisporangium krabiense]MBB5627296.1 RNA polymerase sigma-70 factor (sigma-E family) [Sphaerisporangium krabiense]GII64569.1 RNA polymerase sigma24 factor [Sphaerisporangium krabiense]